GCGDRSGFCSMRIAPNTERSIRRTAGGIGCVRGAGLTRIRRGDETAVALVGADRVSPACMYCAGSAPDTLSPIGGSGVQLERRLRRSQARFEERGSRFEEG